MMKFLGSNGPKALTEPQLNAIKAATTKTISNFQQELKKQNSTMKKLLDWAKANKVIAFAGLALIAFAAWKAFTYFKNKR